MQLQRSQINKKKNEEMRKSFSKKTAEIKKIEIAISELTTYNFQFVELASLLHHHQVYGNSYNHTVSIDSFLGRTLLLSLNRQCHRSHPRHTIDR